jgi:hypothetical protein
MLTILSILFSLSFTFADRNEQLEPKNFCYRGCSQAQHDIWTAFEYAVYLPVTEPAVFSGECYHLSPSYKNTDAHHAVFFLSDVSGATHASGRFSFFAKSNPYEKWEAGSAEVNFPKHQEATRALRPLVRSWFLDHSSVDTVMRYWFRHSADGATMYLTGQWGLNHLLFCELNKH